MIVIVDFGVGNISSVKNMIERLGYKVIISNTPTDLKNADKIILPGVGSYDYGIKNLYNKGLIDVLNEEVLIKSKPILGICLGVQLFSNNSEEGILPGLGWFKNIKTVKFKIDNTSFKVPHMGWSSINFTQKSRIFSSFYDDPRFYFVHSFHLETHLTDNVIATANHSYEFVAAIERQNIVGVQFHPEKSHKYGMLLFKNFIEKY